MSYTKPSASRIRNLVWKANDDWLVSFPIFQARLLAGLGFRALKAWRERSSTLRKQ
ncbi:hypothetical protein HMPREF1255_0638 [Propionimicrobium sp. BV2F7]|nr:hypothetical protein HMPREF1255_0638 [Propionimicrobium sp. BV2F7]